MASLILIFHQDERVPILDHCLSKACKDAPDLLIQNWPYKLNFFSSTKTMEHLIFALSLRLEFKKLGLFDKCLEVFILFFLALHFLILNPLLFLHPKRTPALHLKLRRWIPFNWAQHRAGCLHEGSVPSLTQIAVSSYQIKLLDKWNWFILWVLAKDYFPL